MKTLFRLLSVLLVLCTSIGLFSAFPAAVFAGEEENVALGKPVHTSKDPRNAAKLTDGSADTYWVCPWVPLYAEVDLLENYTLQRVVIRLPLKESNARSYKYAFNVYASVDGVNFDRLAAMEQPLKATEEGFVFDIAADSPYRVVRVMSTMCSRGTSSVTVLSEIEVYGQKSDTPVIATRESLEFPSYEQWLLENCGVDLESLKDADGKYRIADTYTKEDTINALRGLVERILGAQYVDRFVFDVTEPLENNKDYYELSDDNGRIRVCGNCGVSIAAGLNHYLKYFCKVHVSQETVQGRMPEKTVPVGEKIHTECSVPVRYTYNYCTLSYTMPYYGFDDWQRELDYLMLSGVNVILDITATEALWVTYLTQFGYTLEEAKRFVCGYTWKAWWLMGNLEGYGGPVSDTWILDTIEMARVNQRYMTVMGAQPCLQAFVGTMPTDFAAHAGKLMQDKGYEAMTPKMTGTGSWAGFTRPYALNTTYDGFEYLANAFYETQDYIYGRIGDYYAGDFLHEVDSGFQLDKQFNKANMSRTVLDMMLKENKDAVWVIQSWWENPLPEVVQGWGKDRKNHILLLDLAAVQSPRWSDKAKFGGLEFGGSSWCYCILEDYGGREGAHGRLYSLVKSFSNALADAKHLKGIGLTAEGTERNPVVFDLFWEMAWNPRIDAREWVKDYAERRYGGPEGVEAWSTLVNTLYRTATADGTTVNMAFCEYPKFDIAGGYFLGGYKQSDVNEAFRKLIGLFDTFKDEESYVYDMVELVTTDLSNAATRLLASAWNAAKVADYSNFHIYKTKFLHAIALAEELNAFSRNQLLGNWVGRIDRFAADRRTGDYSDFDIDLMKLDAVILVTNWSTIDLGNYANRTYSGLMRYYYYGMWDLFMQEAENRVKAGKKITSGEDRVGYFTGSDFYNVGRQLALDIMNGVLLLPSDPVPAEGDAIHRSLKEVLTEISDFYFYDSKNEATKAVLKEGSGLRIEGGKVCGTVKGLCSAELCAQFDVTCGGRVGVFDGETLLDGADTVSSGMKLVIVEEDGAIYNGLSLTVGELTVDPGAAAEFAEKSSALTGFISSLSIDGNDPDAVSLRTTEVLAGYTVDVMSALLTGSNTLLTDAYDRMDQMKAEIDREKEEISRRKSALIADTKARRDELVSSYNAFKAEHPELASSQIEGYISDTAFIDGAAPEQTREAELTACAKSVERAARALRALTAEKGVSLESAPFSPAALIAFTLVNAERIG